MKYLKYKSLIDPKHKSSNYLPENIYQAQQIAFDNIKKEIKTPLKKWLSKKLNIQKDEDIHDLLSVEQMDSVILAIHNIENNKEFIIGDDTGIGKGRILAAITRYALLHKKKVIFITEAEHLFTDFYRDIVNTRTDSYIKDQIYLFHNNAKVYDAHNNLVCKSLNINQNREIIDSGEFIYTHKNKTISFESNLIFSTYSQFSRLDTAKNKVKFIKNFFNNKPQDCIVLFDEFHNAVGDSTINMIKNDIINLGVNAIHSSATIIDNYTQIQSLGKIIGIHKKDKKAIEKIKKEDNPLIKNQIAYNLTQFGYMLRREHTEVRKINYQEMDDVSEINDNINQYREIILELFNCYKIVEKYNKNAKNKWEELGATINRLAKVIILFGKKDYVVKEIYDSVINQNQKCVITLNSTFDSLISLCIQNSEQVNDQKEYENITFNKVLKIMASDVLQDALLCKDKEFEYLYKRLEEKIDAFPPLELSIIDQISDDLREKGINVLEISGRKQRLIKENGLYKTIPLNQKNKPYIINQFNNSITCKTNETPKEDLSQRYDVVILTLAGSTGTSLHASKDFSDQRVRKMIEIEITPRVKKRVQFFGRVFRKGQVVEPVFVNISSGIDFEKRIIYLEEKKLQSLRAFVGSDYEVKSIEQDYYNPQMSYLAQLYLINHPHIARLLGISIFDNDDKTYHIDMLLKRSILLNNEQQENLFKYLAYGYSIYEQMESSLNMKNEEVDFKSYSTFINYEDKNAKPVFEPYTSEAIVWKVKAEEKTQIEALDNIKINKPLKDYHLNFVNIPNIYGDNQKIIRENFQKMKQMNIGTQVVFNVNHNVYYGFIKDIKIPPNDLKKYITHYLYIVQLINPVHLKDGKQVHLESISVMGNLLLENNNLIISDKPVDIKKYVRKKTTITKNIQLLIGNIFYLNYLKQIYQMGEFKTIEYQGKQILALKIPNNFDLNQIEGKPLLTLEDMQATINMKMVVFTFDKKILIQKKTDGHKNWWIFKVYQNYVHDYQINQNLPPVHKVVDKYDIYKIDDFKTYSKLVYWFFVNEKFDFLVK